MIVEDMKILIEVEENNRKFSEYFLKDEDPELVSKQFPTLSIFKNHLLLDEIIIANVGTKYKRIIEKELGIDSVLAIIENETMTVEERAIELLKDE